MSEPSIVHRLASAVTELSTELAAYPETAHATVAHCILSVLPEADHVGVHRVSGEGFELLAATSEVAERFAALQAEAAVGPSVAAATGPGACRCSDLATDERWSGFGARAADETNMRSALALRMPAGDAGPPVVTTILSARPSAFTEQDALVALAVATCGLLVAVSARHADRVRNLERALETNRDIGTAIGMLMAQRRTSREHAFQLLRSASQSSHRKVSDIARSVIETGSLDV